MDKEQSLIKTENTNANFPAFVEAEKMFDKLAAIASETADRAYRFFLERQGQMGSHVEDWLRAETEMLRTAPVKITEAKDMVNVMVAVPGFKANEIEVSVKGDMLIVSGETAKEDKKEDENTFYSEWTSDKFMRQLPLPSEVEPNDVKCELKDGILSLSLRKKAETEAVKVAVKSA